MTPQGVVLNLGAEHGVTPGLTLQVFGDDTALGLDGKTIGYYRSPVGLLEVTGVEANLAEARVVEQTVAFEPGWKVREVREP